MYELWHSDMNTSNVTKTISVKSTPFVGLCPSSRGNEDRVRQTVSCIMRTEWDRRLMYNAFHFVLWQQGAHKDDYNNHGHKTAHKLLQKQLCGKLLSRRNKPEGKEPRSSEFSLRKCLDNMKQLKIAVTGPTRGCRKGRAAIWQPDDIQGYLACQCPINIYLQNGSRNNYNYLLLMFIKLK